MPHPLRQRIFITGASAGLGRGLARIDGRRLRLVAWKTRRAVYWVSNTLSQSLNQRQMLAIAESLTRLKQ